MEMASNVQSWASSCTTATICVGVMRLPDGQVRGSVSPVTRILTWEPPMSMTRIVAGGAWLCVAVTDPPPRSPACVSRLRGARHPGGICCPEEGTPPRAPPHHQGDPTHPTLGAFLPPALPPPPL